MDHNDIRHKLSEYLDGSVTAEEKSAIEEHLNSCIACSDALRELQKTIEHVKQIEEVDPPAWMTQKIMARVRAGAEEKKGLLQRLFSPLSIKLPIQAVAVLFLAVTAFYVYQDIRPAQKPSRSQMEEFQAKKEAPPAHAAGSEKKITKGTSQFAKRVPQSPEYKALDMKSEYEKPVPPVPEGQAAAPAPAPAKPAEQPIMAKKEVTVGKSAAASQAAAPSKMQEQAAPATVSSADETRRKAQPSISRNVDALLEFQEYLVSDIYKGKPAPIDLSSHPNARTWRTKLIEAATKGPNFAGHYTIATWGCGTSCEALGIIDVITGKVYFPPTLSRVSWAGWLEREHGLKYRIDSALLKVYGSPNEHNEKGIFYYLWKDNKLELLKSDIKK